MNGQQAKLIRKKARKEWKKKLKELRDGDFTERVAVAWWILFGKV